MLLYLGLAMLFWIHQTVKTSLISWLFVSRVSELVLSGAAEYTLTREDVGSRVVFTYIPINFEGLLSLYSLLKIN